MPEKQTTGLGHETVDRYPDRPLPEKPITLKIHQGELPVLLRALARSVGISIIINETVKGTTSVNVVKIPWGQVFEGILKTHGLSYAWEGELLRIVTLADKTDMVKQLEADRKLLSARRQMALAEPLVTKIVHVDYADAGNLKNNLKHFLSPGDDGKTRGSVLVDDHNNALIIQATRSDLERILALITELDQPTAQVLIEAHIIETTRQTARELGVQWGGAYRWHRKSDNYWITPNAGNAIGVGSSTDNLNPTTGWAGSFPADLTSATVAGSGLSLGMIAETSNAILSAQLTALEEENKLNILSKPSITTLDNQAAIIESGNDIPFQTVNDNKVQVEYKKAVLRLEVTPHVIEGDTLRLDIVTNKDEPDFSRTVNGNPTVITKYAKTNVVVFDGQTTVIGGLNKQTGQNLDYGTPWLRNVPGLGYLFKGSSKGQQMQELLIFITPHILKSRLPDSGTAGGTTGSTPAQQD